MRILIVGGGGREHALAVKIKESPKVKEIFCAPGNAGISQVAQCLDIASEDIDGLLDFALKNDIDLTIVGPEAPLTMGIVDKFQDKGLRIFGPSELAAEIEGSKAFSKNLMKKYQIPTAQYMVFTEENEAKAYLKEIGMPCVVKADGLAAGKGVMVCFEEEEAIQAINEIMLDKCFGSAGNKVVIEEYLEGQEVSMLAFTDGKAIIPMVSAQDHKRIFDNDQGPNTGGMGAYSPTPIYTEEIHEFVLTEVLEKTVKAMAQEGRRYKGVLYAGLMLTAKGVKVLEFNARFGDPETQVVLPRLKTDLVEIMEAVIDENLHNLNVEWSPEPAVCVVLAAKGYPGEYEKGQIITGLDQIPPEVQVFHGGTTIKDGQIVTSGGRVLGVTALGQDFQGALELAYKSIEKIHFSGMQYRKDIGRKALKKVL